MFGASNRKKLIKKGLACPKTRRKSTPEGVDAQAGVRALGEGGHLWRVCAGSGPFDFFGRASRSGEIFFDRTACLSDCGRSALD